jgi:hypothetical protein
MAMPISHTHFNSIVNLPVADNLTALAAGGRTGATLISAQINRFAVVATAGDSAVLPAANPYIPTGYILTVINNGAKAMTVYGNGSDTINGIAGATGVSVPAGSTVQFITSVAAKWFTLSLGGGVNGNFFTLSSVDALTALAGGGRTGATAITANITRFSVVATSGDSSVLPVAAPGLFIEVINDGAAPMQVFALGSDTIDGTAGATGVSLVNAKRAIFSSTVAGKWVSLVGA